ncbi:MAG: 23S rRNA (guanosine(2251)-2'-O)-methyltransferase RlmB [Alphaproteobacteria bacterium]
MKRLPHRPPERTLPEGPGAREFRGDDRAPRSGRPGRNPRQEGRRRDGRDAGESPQGPGYVVPGWHATRAFVEARPAAVRRVLLSKEAPEDVARAVRAEGIPVEQAEAAMLDRLAGGVVTQGVVALGVPPDPVDLRTLDPTRDRLVLALDGITDPRNVGAIVRSAEAAGVSALVMPRDRSPGWTPALVKAAAGATEWLPIARVTNLARSLSDLSRAGYWILGLDGDGEADLFDPAAIPGPPCVLVAGSEGSGLRELTRRGCHRVVRIPMKGRVESLNASVAVAIALFELRRREAASAGHP